MAEPAHPIVAVRRVLMAGVFMPVLVGLAWWKAVQFDPYTTSFFTKTYVAPSPAMPDEFRLFGGVVIVIGALVILAFANGLWRRRVVFREIWLEMLWALQVIAFGGAFFVAADRAEQLILAQETKT